MFDLPNMVITHHFHLCAMKIKVTCLIIKCNFMTPAPKMQLWILMSVRVLSLRLLCQILHRVMASYNTMKMLRWLNLR